jgi:choline monooxygenase
MYVHQHQLEHLLEPRHYHDERHYRREIERIFRASWQLVGTTRDLARSGDYITTELFGTPLMVRNVDGDVLAFENVCPHRHCLLSSRPKGHSRELRCQYHGWQFNRQGTTGRIPDARCFRPWDREHARLRTVHVDTCGELIFVSLADEGPSLEEYLGDHYEQLRSSFSPPYAPAWRWEVPIDADWKIPVENTVEFYHVPCLHPKTLKRAAPEETIRHVLDPRFTQLHTRNYEEWVDPIKNWIVRRLGETPSPDYVHHLAHPNFVFIGMDVFRLAEVFIPTDPGTSLQRVIVYSLHGRRRNPLARSLALLLRTVVRGTVRKILSEDLPIFPAQQRGMRSSTHRGVLGTLEERIHVFQKYVLDACYPERSQRSKPVLSTKI